MNLSIEHAAIASQLTCEEEELVMLLGKGCTDCQIANKTGLTLHTVIKRQYNLRARTRMNRLQLAMLGYALRAAC